MHQSTEGMFASNKDFRQHCVIFFVPIGDTTNEESGVIQMTSYFISRVKSLGTYTMKCHFLGIESVVVLSKVDTLFPDIRTQDQNLSNIIAEASKKLKVFPQNIFPLVNYTVEEQKVLHIDKILYRILFRASFLAKSRYISMH